MHFICTNGLRNKLHNEQRTVFNHWPMSVHRNNETKKHKIFDLRSCLVPHIFGNYNSPNANTEKASQSLSSNERAHKKQVVFEMSCEFHLVETTCETGMVRVTTRQASIEHQIKRIRWLRFFVSADENFIHGHDFSQWFHAACMSVLSCIRANALLHYDRFATWCSAIMLILSHDITLENVEGHHVMRATQSIFGFCCIYGTPLRPFNSHNKVAKRYLCWKQFLCGTYFAGTNMLFVSSIHSFSVYSIRCTLLWTREHSLAAWISLSLYTYANHCIYLVHSIFYSSTVYFWTIFQS